MKGAETQLLPALLLAGAGYYVFQAATAGERRAGAVDARWRQAGVVWGPDEQPLTP